MNWWVILLAGWVVWILPALDLGHISSPLPVPVLVHQSRNKKCSAVSCESGYDPITHTPRAEYYQIPRSCSPSPPSHPHLLSPLVSHGERNSTFTSKSAPEMCNVRLHRHESDNIFICMVTAHYDRTNTIHQFYFTVD